MTPFLLKLLQSVQTYHKYFGEALIEIYLHYTSPWPIYMLLKKWALANRKLRIIWTPKSSGRKPLASKIINLILEVKKLNPTWGAQKISDELAKVGYKVCKKTVIKYLELHNLNSPSPRKGISWSQFLENHKFKIGIDFTSLISFSGRQLYVFVMIDIDTRSLIHINVTYNPCSQWVKQQFRNAFFDMDEYPSLCLCDRDTIFCSNIEEMLQSYFDMKLRRIPYKSPQKNGKVERFHLSLKSEGFANTIPINLLQAQKICTRYKEYYNNYRPHQGIQGKVPKYVETYPESPVKFIKKEHLGGKFVSLEAKKVA